MIKVLGTQQLFVKWEQYLPYSVQVAQRPEWGPQITLLSFLPSALTMTLRNQTRCLKLYFDYRKPQLFLCPPSGPHIQIQCLCSSDFLSCISSFSWTSILSCLDPSVLIYLSFFFFSLLAMLGLNRIVRAFSICDARVLEHAGSVVAAQSCFIACGISVP